MGNPIDLVIPMVFPQDALWRQKYSNYNGNNAATHVRYRSWGTEELLVRCCITYMPWIRSIILVLASESQVQEWMHTLAAKPQGTERTEVRVVFHREFIPSKYLPCFSSPCIEMFLDRIPGLSDHFIYANDDMFPLSPLEPDDFFRPSPLTSHLLLPCMHITEKPFPPGANIFQRKCMFQQNMVGRPFGRLFSSTWLRTGHSFAPILKTACQKVWHRHGTDIEANLSPRQRTARSCNHYIYMLYQYFAGLYVDYAPRRQLVLDSTPTAQLEGILADPYAGIVCINDNESIRDWEERAAVVRRMIAWNLERHSMRTNSNQ